jgi:hypothetical protein
MPTEVPNRRRASRAQNEIIPDSQEIAALTPNSTEMPDSQEVLWNNGTPDNENMDMRQANQDGLRDEGDRPQRASRIERAGMRVTVPTRLTDEQRKEYQLIELDDDAGDDEPEAVSRSQVKPRPIAKTTAKKKEKKDKEYVPDGGAESPIPVPPGPSAASAARLFNKLPSMEAAAAAYMQEHLPPVKSLAEVKLLCPRMPLGASWTEREQKIAAKLWNKRFDRTAMLKIGHNTTITGLYKSCLRFMRCLPMQIIGLQHNMEHDVIWTESQGKCMTHVFCATLKDLLVHPMWKGSPDKLALAIQYAIIVKSDDRRPWNPPAKALLGRGSSFLRDLHRASQDEPDISLVEHRRRIAEQDQQAGGRAAFDCLLECIEKQIQKKKKKHNDKSTEGRRLGKGPYVVKQVHLNMVAAALDKTGVNGCPMFLPVETLSRLINNRRPTSDYPQKDQLRELRDYELFAEFERRLCRQRQDNESDSDAEPEPEPELPLRKGKRKATAAPTRSSKRLRRQVSKEPSLSFTSDKDDEYVVFQEDAVIAATQPPRQETSTTPARENSSKGSDPAPVQRWDRARDTDQRNE